MTILRYSQWDGTQRIFDLDEDRIMKELSDDLLHHGDLNRALRRLLQRGIDGADGQRVSGLRDLMDRLRQQQQEQLERYNLDSIMDEFKQRLDDIVQTERQGIDKRLDEAQTQASRQSEDQQQHLEKLLDMLRDRAEQNRQRLDALPPNPAGQFQELSNLDFMDPEAQRKFQELTDLLKQRLMQNHFQDLKDAMQGMSPGDMGPVKEMLRQLNQMLQDRMQGRQPDFDGFMQQFGGMFGPNPPQSLDELLERLAEQMARAQSLFNSLSPEQRRELMDMMEQVMDPELAQQLAQLAAAMGRLLPPDELSGRFPFLGDEDISYDEAMDLMGQFQTMDRLEDQLQLAMRRGALAEVDPELLQDVLGEDARRQYEELQQIARMLEDAGYLKRDGDKLELTPRGVRKIAQGALDDLFHHLKKDRMGGHEVRHRGAGGEITGETKTYEFGDPFDVDLRQTVVNGVIRQGPGAPVHLQPDDFEIHRTEHQVQAATVLLLDLSRSMELTGSFFAAKKVALALYALIHSKFPRDELHLIGFSGYAQELKQEELPQVTCNLRAAGTNMQHAFMLSRRLLSRFKGGSKQIIMITDGEPTAHLEGRHIFFHYPPTHRTVSETLKEVKRCTSAGITINTFMLETNSYLLDFVDRMTRINQGRAFYTNPDDLGQYVLVDYYNNRRKRVRS